MPRCSMCRLEKPEADFYRNNQRKGMRDSHCKGCCSATVAWTAESYSRVHEFNAEEEYLIGRLVEQPTLTAGLDEIYRRSPRRWHQVVVASTLRRKGN